MEESLKNPLFEGDVLTTTKTRCKNSMAIQTIANIAKGSFGPLGLDKMLVDDSGSITVTNDGATIFSLLDISDPAARLLASMARSQDQAAGDGTTSVIILAGELVKLSIEKIQEGFHPGLMSAGIVKASKLAIKYINDYLTIDMENYKKKYKRDILRDSIATSLNSKVVNSYISHFSPLVSEAVSGSKSNDQDSVQVLLRAGESIEDSKLLKGFGIATVPVNEKLFENKNLIKGRVILINNGFEARRLDLGQKINLTDTSTINQVKKTESELPIKVLKKLKENNIIGIISSCGFSSDSERLMENLGIFGIKRLEFKHLDRLASILKCRIFGNLDSILEANFNEKLYDEMNFSNTEIEHLRLNEGSIMLIRDDNDSFRSIIVRGPNEWILDEVERSIHDALCVGFKLKNKKGYKDNKIIAGGGSTELSTAVYLEELSGTYGSKIEIPMKIFAQSLLSIPETLAVNSGLNVSFVINTIMEKYKSELQRKEIKNDEDILIKYMGIGVDQDEPIVYDMLEKGIVEPLASKIKIIEIATEAALAILRVDESINLYPKQQPKKK